MRLVIPAILIAIAVPFATSIAAAAESKTATPAYVTSALNDPVRKEDAANDERRKTADVVTFTKVKPGQKVLAGEHASGLNAIERALALNPNCALAWAFCGWARASCRSGRRSSAIAPGRLWSSAPRRGEWH